MSFFFYFLSILFFSSYAWGLEWNYNHQKLWPHACKGSRQSPIPLRRQNATINNFLSLKYSNGYHGLISGTLTNTGKTIRFDLPKNEEIYVTVDKTKKYFLESAYYHWPAEHTVNGVRLLNINAAGSFLIYPLEIQLSHYREDLTNLDEARNVYGGVFTISLLFKLSEKDNLLLDPIVNAAPLFARRTLRPVPVNGVFGRLLPTGSFYRYRGSVPRPSCQQNVIWQIYPTPSTISKKQLQVITNVYTATGQKILYNNRELQKVDDRFVYYKI